MGRGLFEELFSMLPEHVTSGKYFGPLGVWESNGWHNLRLLFVGFDGRLCWEGLCKTTGSLITIFRSSFPCWEKWPCPHSKPLVFISWQGLDCCWGLRWNYGLKQHATILACICQTSNTIVYWSYYSRIRLSFMSCTSDSDDSDEDKPEYIFKKKWCVENEL